MKTFILVAKVLFLYALLATAACSLGIFISSLFDEFNLPKALVALGALVSSCVLLSCYKIEEKEETDD